MPLFSLPLSRNTHTLFRTKKYAREANGSAKTDGIEISSAFGPSEAPVSIRLDQEVFGTQTRSALTKAFAVSMSLRMIATMATIRDWIMSRMNEPPATDRVHRRCRTPAARSVSGFAQPRAKAAHRRWTTSPRRRILRGSEGYRPVTDRAGSGYRRAWRAGNSVGVVVKLYSSKFIHEFSRLCHVRQPKKHRR